MLKLSCLFSRWNFSQRTSCDTSISSRLLLIYLHALTFVTVSTKMPLHVQNIFITSQQLPSKSLEGASRISHCGFTTDYNHINHITYATLRYHKALTAQKMQIHQPGYVRTTALRMLNSVWSTPIARSREMNSSIGSSSSIPHPAWTHSAEVIENERVKHNLSAKSNDLITKYSTEVAVNS